jgi:endonuclease/exonuclease/phosphatase family metal-dependent hydrolase
MHRNIIAAAALGLAALVGGTAPTEAVTAAGSSYGGVDVRVGSFNIQSVSLDRTRGEQRPWKQRRGAVLQHILGENLDVLGVQEANPSSYWAPRLVGGTTQYRDLRNGLNNAGGHFALANGAPFNCVNAKTSYKCAYKYRGASQSDRILYNTQTLQLVSQGSVKYARQASSGDVDPRYLAWAVFRVRATGSEFLFANTHLTNLDDAAKVAQWRQLISEIDRRMGTRPVIAVGDFNTQKFDPLTVTMLPAMTAAGYGDVLNQQYAVNPVRTMRAESTVNGWINSFNHERRDVSTFGYDDHRERTGNGIDWIFATNALPVREWKVVLDYDPQTLQVRGVLPSDHNMVRATLTLP